MTIKKQFKSGLLLYCLTTVLFAGPSDADKLQQLAAQFLNTHRADEHITAVAITLQSSQHPNSLSVYAGTRGQDDPETINAHSLFQIGSITKSFVTAVLLKLESDQRYHFNLNDPIDKFFPEYKNWHSVTVKQLMNMTSGIPDYFSDKTSVTEFAAHPYRERMPVEWINRIYQKPLLFTPGTHYHYSNTNYLLLGRLIEKLTGHSLSFEIKHRLLIPLQLKHTYFVRHYPKKSVRLRLVRGYQFEEGFADYLPRGTDVTEYSLSYLNAAGGMISTSENMTKWIHALLTPGNLLNDREWRQLNELVSQNNGRVVTELTTEDALGFGLGIRMQYSPTLQSTYYIYQGMTLGYRAIYFYLPARHTLVAVTVNSSFDSKQNHLIELMNQVGQISEVAWVK